MTYIKIWAGEQNLIKQHLQMIRYITNKNIVGNVPLSSIIFVNQGYIEKYFDENSIKKIREQGKKLLNKNEGLKLIDGTKNAIKNYWLKANQLKQDYSKFDEFEYALLNLFAYFITSTEYVTQILEEKIIEILKNYYGNNYQDFMNVLLTPTRKDIIQKEKEDFLKVKNNPTDENLINQMNKYPFLFTNTFSFSEAFELMKERLKEDEIIHENKKDKIKKTQKSIYNDVNHPDLFYFTNLIRTLSVLRIGLKVAWSGMHFYLLDFFTYISKKAEVSLKDVMMFYTSYDIKHVLQGIILNKEELEKRKKYYLLIYNNGFINYYSGKDALNKKNELIPEVKKLNEIKGSIANKGYVKGKVILLKTDNLKEVTKIANKIKEDSILVTGMTNPNIMVLIKKVKGIVTDEGGISCHAAIVSREYDLPCVIGTKHATDIFENDDLIELDADKGIVRKIEP